MPANLGIAYYFFITYSILWFCESASGRWRNCRSSNKLKNIAAGVLGLRKERCDLLSRTSCLIVKGCQKNERASYQLLPLLLHSVVYNDARFSSGMRFFVYPLHKAVDGENSVLRAHPQRSSKWDAFTAISFRESQWFARGEERKRWERERGGEK